MQTFEAVRVILWRNLCVSRWSIPTVKGHKGHEHALLRNVTIIRNRILAGRFCFQIQRRTRKNMTDGFAC